MGLREGKEKEKEEEDDFSSRKCMILFRYPIYC